MQRKALKLSAFYIFRETLSIHPLMYITGWILYNANRFVEVAKYYLQEQDKKIKAKAIIPHVQLKKENVILNIELTYSKLSTYETIL